MHIIIVTPTSTDLSARIFLNAKIEGTVVIFNYEPDWIRDLYNNLDQNIEISVRDNGDGIPEEIKDKIFQPFFTTKPTGQGIGLGLSLAYDIVKAHGGELKVETKEGEGARFTIVLPV